MDSLSSCKQTYWRRCHYKNWSFNKVSWKKRGYT